MVETITLDGLSNAASPVGSSMTFGVSMNIGGAKSFSCPPFIFYALKAKVLASHGIKDESLLSEKQRESIALITQSLRDEAKKLYLNLKASNVSLDHFMSTHLQDVFLSMLLNEPVSANIPTEIPPAISINATRTKKNITVPHYVMRRLVDLLGSDVAARQLIHKFAYQVKEDLVDAKAIDASGKLCGGAENSTWSRKVHNKIFHYLLKMSGVPETLKAKPGKNGKNVDIFSVKLLRESKRETINHKAKTR